MSFPLQSSDGGFSQWRPPLPTHSYNPSVRQPEQELCSECGHLQTEHDLDNAGFDRETLKEFSLRAIPFGDFFPCEAVFVSTPRSVHACTCHCEFVCLYSCCGYEFHVETLIRNVTSVSAMVVLQRVTDVCFQVVLFIVVSRCLFMCANLLMFSKRRVCVCVCVSLSLCLCMCVSVCVCICMYTYMCVCNELHRPDVAQQYHIRLSPDEPPRHPADIPQFQLQEFYAKNPEFPGSSGLCMCILKPHCLFFSLRSVGCSWYPFHVVVR